MEIVQRCPGYRELPLAGNLRTSKVPEGATRIEWYHGASHVAHFFQRNPVVGLMDPGALYHHDAVMVFFRPEDFLSYREVPGAAERASHGLPSEGRICAVTLARGGCLTTVYALSTEQEVGHFLNGTGRMIRRDDNVLFVNTMNPDEEGLEIPRDFHQQGES
jgi:hypothetical protein